MSHPSRGQHGFTLVELLTVVGILALLASLLVPSAGAAWTKARVVKVHADLKAVTGAIELYRNDNNETLPPTRFSCNLRTAYELPVELTRYLPGGTKGGMDIVQMPDAFTPEECYKYRAVGPAIVNESTVIPNGANLWIPDGFPGPEAQTGKYYSHPATSPVRYAVYSLGPDPQAGKFDVPGRLPVPRRYWMTHPMGTGVIVHFEDARGEMHVSP